MQKRVLIFDSGKEWGGGTNSLIELLKRIDKDAFKFYALFYRNYRKGDESDIKSELENLGINFISLDQKKLPFFAKALKELVRVVLFFSKTLQKPLIFLIDYRCRITRDAKMIARLLQEHRIDLLYMNNQPSSNLEGTIAAGIAGVAVLQHTRIEPRLNPIEVRLSNRWVTKIICVSEAVRGSIVRQGIDSSKCLVVHNGIDAKTALRRSVHDVRSKWGIAETDVLVGTVCSLVKRKRVGDFIEVASMIARRMVITEPAGRPVKFIVVGEGPEEKNLKTEVEKRSLTDKFIFAGFQPDAISFINAMDIFVLTSEKEGLPRVILEAMLMAKPVVASDIAGPSELVINDETGYLLPLGKPEMFADRITGLIGEPGMMAQMGDKGRKRVIEEYSIDKYVEGVTAVLSEVTGN